MAKKNTVKKSAGPKKAAAKKSAGSKTTISIHPRLGKATLSLKKFAPEEMGTIKSLSAHTTATGVASTGCWISDAGAEQRCINLPADVCTRHGGISVPTRCPNDQGRISAVPEAWNATEAACTFMTEICYSLGTQRPAAHSRYSQNWVPLCRQPPSVCSGLRRARQHSSYRRLAGLRRMGEEGIRSRGDVSAETTTQRSLHSSASGTPGRVASEAVAGRYTPRGRVTQASVVLPRRVYVSL
jgi:hypothetical protein